MDVGPASRRARGAARVLDLVGGLDSVWYFQMWLVGLGRQTFEGVTSDPDTLAEVSAVQRFLYLQSNRIPRTDEDWDLDDPEESARRLPRCTSYIRQLYGRA
ncbi:DUF4240 domain-containing protein [Nonomuraea endophytica]|uniref:DUF4240 domain-containing protein n=1 Tax=Nonomuraea endophytica TaxID=714136 RepID=UPI0037C9D2F5